MPKNKIKTTKKPHFYIISLTILISVALVVFNDFGLLKLFQLQRQYRELESSLASLLLQQERLRIDINKLQTDNEYIKKIAREKFMMVLPGEKVYRVEESKKY